MNAIANELRARAQDYREPDSIGPFLAECADEIDRLTRERDEARAVVERLPKTADGVPIFCGNIVFGAWDDAAIVMSVEEKLVHIKQQGGWFYRGFSECYSTREAAKKARQAQKS